MMTGHDDILDALPTDQRDRLAVVLDEYLVSLEKGVPLPLEDLAHQHPDLAEPLRVYAESLRFLTLATDQLDRQRPTTEPTPSWDRLLGDFRLIREVGRGGMGVVYEAEQVSLGRRVALKVLPFAAVMDQKQLARFTNEARAAAQLNHPNIVPVYGVGNERGVHYYSMQFIHGQPIDRLIEELRDWQTRGRETGVATATVRSDERPPCSVPPAVLPRTSLRDREYYRSVARLGIQAAEALHHAHEMGVVHRDIKPSNLLLDGSGKLWIADFGLARVQTDTNMTLSGAVMGTARYMSPEQASGKTHLVDHRADVYSLGITLYELLTLQPAFDALNPQQFLRQIEREEPPAPRRVNPALPADLETIILKAIDKNREARYQTAEDLAEDFRRFLDGRPTLARRPTLLDRLGKWSTRHATFVAAAAAILLVALLAAGASVALVAREKRQTVAALQTAQRELQRAEANYRQARQVVDRYGLRLAEELAAIPGVEPLRRELLEDTLQCYDALLRQTRGHHALRVEQAMTHFKAAEIASLLGDSQRALRDYAAARDLFAALAQDHPASAEHRSHQGLCINNLGLVLASVGRLDEAKAAFQRANELLTELCRDDPQDSAHRWRLSLVHTNVGLVHAQQGTIADADASYARAIGLLQRLVEAEPARDEYRKDLAVAFNNRGALHRNGNPALAAEYNGRAIRLLAALAETHPQRLDYLSELALCHSNQGVLLAELGQGDQGRAALDRAIAAQEQLVRRAPAVVAYRRDLAVSHNNLGRVLLDAGELAAADDSLAQAQAMLQDLAADYPDTVEYCTSLGGVLNNRATIQEKQGQPAQAAALYEQAVQRLTRARELAPKAIEPRQFLSQVSSNHARVLRALNGSQ